MFSINYFFFLDGSQEEVQPNKITSRIQKLCYGLNLNYVNPVSKTCNKLVINKYLFYKWNKFFMKK